MTEQKKFMRIESSNLNDDKTEIELMFINGQRIEIKKDTDVEVKPIIKELYDECRANFVKGNTQKSKLVLEG